MRNLSGKMKDRLVQKFVELDHAKTDRLLELHFKYMDKMDEADEDIAKTARMLANEGQAMDEEMVYIQKMELGLFTLQQVCTIPDPFQPNRRTHVGTKMIDSPKSADLSRRAVGTTHIIQSGHMMACWKSL